MPPRGKRPGMADLLRQQRSELDSASEGEGARDAAFDGMPAGGSEQSDPPAKSQEPAKKATVTAIDAPLTSPARRAAAKPAGPAPSTLVDAWELVAAAGRSVRDTPGEWEDYNSRLPAYLWRAVQERGIFDAGRVGERRPIPGNWYLEAAFAGLTGPDLAAQMGVAWRDRMRAAGADPVTLPHRPAGSKLRSQTRHHLTMTVIPRLSLMALKVPAWVAFAAAVEALLDRLQREHPDPDYVPPRPG